MEQAAQWLAGYDERLARAAANAKAANESLRQMSGTATSPRGEVAVQVGPSGAMEDIRLTPAARALEAEQLAQLILTTAQQAQRTVGAQVVEIMTEYVGDGPALEFVKENMPPAAGVEAGQRRVDDDNDDDFFANPVVIV
ncbi:YbaB/EbfC family nucleoid-associated protein [Saccharopolyspora sp. WRP15-2]|uniref:YbaB/EbfC family nucleoid-associated protein n=1 Tax=Saccharopolyspora oryzae TaxID=2997343 RepID=A0ABT4V929_9PSEU|nr:YbaB/EbfC family nucleoid-associated protein [Saccharopolyspora oryzae]MDA3630462.1 YbaB/EbfC family nucleoid-associated protein [Saccharopolyspora oryzae]